MPPRWRVNVFIRTLTNSMKQNLLDNLIIPFRATGPQFMTHEGCITMFRRVRYSSLCWASSVQSMPSLRIYLRSVLILNTRLRLSLQIFVHTRRNKSVRHKIFPLFHLLPLNANIFCSWLFNLVPIDTFFFKFIHNMWLIGCCAIKTGYTRS